MGLGSSVGNTLFVDDGKTVEEKVDDLFVSKFMSRVHISSPHPTLSLPGIHTHIALCTHTNISLMAPPFKNSRRTLLGGCCSQARAALVTS